jgi:hypothetical protein
MRFEKGLLLSQTIHKLLRKIKIEIRLLFLNHDLLEAIGIENLLKLRVIHDLKSRGHIFKGH